MLFSFLNLYFRSPSGYIEDNLQLGGAVYATISLSNHGCWANTIRNNVSNYGVVRAAKTILPGEEIVDNYGHYFQVKPKSERQHDLRIQYYFVCDCAACKGSWPLYRDLPSEPTFICSGCKADVKKPEKVKKCQKCKRDLKLGPLLRVLSTFQNDVSQAISEINETNADTYIRQFKGILNLMENSVRHPCKKFIICQQVQSQCYAVKSNVSYPT